MAKYITAVDFGTTKTAVAVGQKSSSGVKILAYSEKKSKGINRGDVLNIKAVKNNLMDLVKEVEDQMRNIKGDFKVTKIYTGISGANIRCEKTTVTRSRPDPSRTIEQQEVDGMQADAYKSFISEDEVVLHVIPQCYNIDDLRGLTDIEGHQGKEVMGFYILFIGRKKSADHTSSVITKAGYQVGKLILEPLACARGVLTEEEMELGAALVDIGGGTTNILLYKDNCIRYSTVIPFGGNAITQDIRQVCNVTERHAEVMKRKHGSCLSTLGADNKYIGITDDRNIITRRIPFRQLFETIEARTEEIIATVKYEIAAAGMEDRINRIVLTGGTANLNQIAVLFRQMTGCSVRQAFPDERKILSSSVPEIFKYESSTLAGLLLKGFDYELDEDDQEEIDDSAHAQEENEQQSSEDDEEKNPAEKKDTKLNIFDLFKGRGRNRNAGADGKPHNDNNSQNPKTPKKGREKDVVEKGLFDGFFNDTDDEA